MKLLSSFLQSVTVTNEFKEQINKLSEMHFKVQFYVLPQERSGISITGPSQVKQKKLEKTL